MKVLAFLFLGLVLRLNVSAHDTTVYNRYVKENYEKAYNFIDSCIEACNNQSFKHAVFKVEDTYLDNSLDYDAFQLKIAQLATLVRVWCASNRLQKYNFPDSANFLKNYGIYVLMKDTIKFAMGDSGRIFSTIPYVYDFEDFSGRENWTKMFVTKSLFTQSGNCHSLPFLYKILADEVEATAWLALAPNHIYIKNRCAKMGWYNTELTSGNFPIDAWIATSGYIPIQAIRSGIYMDTLSNRQSIALCLIDLAKGYEAKTKNYADSFIIRCCDRVLQVHPKNTQAMLLKAEVLKHQYLNAPNHSISHKTKVFSEMQNLYLRLYDLGYREMPDKMYLQWLSSLEKEQAKYQNKGITN